MYRRSRTLLIAALGLGMALACTGGADDASSPERHVSSDKAAPERRSTLVLPTTLSLDLIAEQLNAGTPDPVYKEKAVPVAASVVADVTVRRDGDIRTAVRGEALRSTIPVRVRVSAYRKRSDGSKGAELGKGRARLLLLVDTTFSLEPDWTLLADATVRYRWEESPTMKIGPITLDVEESVDAQLKAQIPELEAALEEEIRDAQLVRSQAGAVWRSLWQPRDLSEDPRLHMLFTPEGLFATSPAVGPSGLAITLGAQGAVDVRDGKAPKNRSVAEKLPEQLPLPKTQSTRLFLPLRLSWEAVTGLAQAQLAGQSHTESLPAGGKLKVKLTEVLDVYPSGDRIAVGLSLDAEAAGAEAGATVWLLGKPHVNVGTRELSLRDFSFSATSDSAAINGALKVLDGPIQDAVAEQLVFPLGEQLDLLRDQANDALSENTAVDDGVRLEASLSSLDLLGVHLEADHLVIDTRIGGELSAHIGSEQ